MKFQRLIIFLVFILGCAPSFQNIIKEIEPTNDPTYGYFANNPIKIGYYDITKSINASYKYISLLRTQDDKPLRLILSGTVDAPEGIKEKNIPMRFGSSIESGILDFYMLIVEGTKDTLTLYFDSYQKDKLSIPVGLKIKKEKD